MEEKKNVPKRRFEGFEGEWEQHRLGESYHVTMGQSPQSSNYTKNPDDHILVQGNADITNGKIVPRVWTKQITKNAEKGDVILTVRAPVGEVAISNYDIVLGRGVAALKGSYFLYSLLMYMEQIQYWDRFSTGSTFESINSDNIENAIIFIPNILEQQQIGQFFQQLDNLIELHQQKLQKLKAQKQAYLSEMFPQEGETKPKRRFAGFDGEWETFYLNEIAEKFDNLRIPITSSKRIGGPTPYYGANGIQDYVQGFTHDGEFVLLAEDGANDLQNYPVHFVNGKVWVNNHAHVLQGKSDVVDNYFLMFLLKQLDFTPYLVGGSRAKLNADIMMGLKVIIPTYKEQQKNGAFFQKLDSLIEKQEERVKKYQALKQAYLNEMFV